MKKILIVEDDTYITDLYKRFFEKEGFIIDTAGDGEEGEAKARQFSPDLIILDIMIPKVSGIDLLKKIKADPTLSKIIVVILSNLAQEDTIKKEALALGAAGYLVKSMYTPEEVVNQIKTFVK